jgi:hypothetical protein
MSFESSAKNAHVIHEASLIGRPDVAGVGVGHRTVGDEQTDEVCLKVFVPTKLPPHVLSSSRMLPSYVPASDGTPIRVDVEETGPIFAPPLRDINETIVANHAANEAFRAGRSVTRAVQTAINAFAAERRKRSLITAPLAVPTLQSLLTRRRPAPGGTGVAHFIFSIGTLTTGVIDRHPTSAIYALSCNHVLALASRARLGDPILQPPALAGGMLPRDFIGILARFVPLSRNPAIRNTVDGAIALAIPPTGVSVAEIAGVGPVRGIRAAASLAIGERVKSVGAATGLLEGHIIAVNVTLKITYASLNLVPGLFMFGDQIVTTPMSAFGDSGAMLLDLGNNAVGMLFAGCVLATGYNPIEEVQRQLGIVIVDRLVERIVLEQASIRLTREVYYGGATVPANTGMSPGLPAPIETEHLQESSSGDKGNKPAGIMPKELGELADAEERPKTHKGRHHRLKHRRKPRSGS